ncbi:MAG TPA: lipase maturation factor family protein [Candidatus Udaeobacter sp.]|nr:lipase maturation factor family protein [Candidatus Udaeobacter sp.]
MRIRVSNSPSKPLLIWDGECHFCRRWIERWREITVGKVEYETYQEAANRFPEIPIEQFKRAVAFIEPDGKAFFAAEAVYRSLRYRSSRRWLAWSYDRVPGVAAVSELAYKFIARHRGVGSAVTRLLWGNDVRPPTYLWARRWFLRALGVIYLIAFVSLWVQVDGLIGSNGISPVSQFLPAVHEQLGGRAYSLLPTLCWFNSSNAFLHFLCASGVVSSLLLIAGLVPVVSLIALFVLYLSLTIAGQGFLSFQWDILLLETGFLAIFLAPWQSWPKRGREPPVSRAALFLLKLLLFKLMVMSGVVKLTSGDDSWGWLDHSFHWSALTALDYHYWSQPLPTVFGWWADKSPEWFKHFSVAFCLTVEIIAPFFIWAPRRPRLIAAGLIVFLQIAIAVTGNYCFFNLLTIALCFLLIDDAAIGRKYEAVIDRRYSYRLSSYGAIAVIILTVPINACLIFTAFKPDASWPRPLAAVYGRVEAFRIVNGYGLFRVMTKDRGEIVIEGSADGIDWLPYEFKWKPGDVKRAPGWCAPHQPRVDWQMWFAALGTPQQNPWFGGLVVRLLQGSRDVSRLLARNPFPDQPPRYIRVSFYRYRFTTLEEHRQSGAWWKRQELGEYLPTVSLDQLR